MRSFGEIVAAAHRFAVRHWQQGSLILMVWAVALWLPDTAQAGVGPQLRRGGAENGTTAAGPRGGEIPMTASWYGREQHQHLTASGQRYDMYQYTAANKSLPLGTILVVRNPSTGASCRVLVNDRGPYIRGRDLDLSYAAARDLGLLTCGVARLYVKTVGHDSRYDKYWKNGVPLAAE